MNNRLDFTRSYSRKIVKQTDYAKHVGGKKKWNMLAHFTNSIWCKIYVLSLLFSSFFLHV